jgi:ATP phosphoribosyltransferase
MTSERLSVTTTSDEQIDAFEEAADAVARDVEDGVVDAKVWGGDVPNGEVVRILAEAYTGALDVDSEAARARER